MTVLRQCCRQFSLFHYFWNQINSNHCSHTFQVMCIFAGWGKLLHAESHQIHSACFQSNQLDAIFHRIHCGKTVIKEQHCKNGWPLLQIFIFLPRPPNILHYNLEKFGEILQENKNYVLLSSDVDLSDLTLSLSRNNKIYQKIDKKSLETWLRKCPTR